MTHLRPGGGFPRVHGARSPVPTRLPHFATPRSMHHLAAVAAGNYPPHRPPNAWSPGVSAPPGPCYWLVASGTSVRCVWRAVPPGCPLSSLAGTPFHAVCAFRGLGPVAILVFPACLLCVRALALSRCPPPPPRAAVARAPCAIPVLDAGRAVPRGPCPSACPASVPCSAWLALGEGAAGSPFPSTWLGAVPSLWGGSARLERSNAGGWGGGWLAPRPPWCRGRGGQWGGESSYFGPSLCLPWAGNKAGVFGVPLAMEGVAPISLRFLLAGCPQARSVWRPCALARVRLSIAVPAAAGRWGRGGGRCCTPPPRAPGSFQGGVRARLPCGPRVGWGKWGDKGGGRAVVLNLPPLNLLRRRYVFGRGRGVAPGAGRGLPLGGQLGGGGGGGLCAAPPGGVARGPSGAGVRSASVRLSAFPWRATKQVSLATLWSWRAWPPYCSGLCSRAAPGRGPCVALCDGAGSPACCGPCGSRRWGAWERAACGLSCVPPLGAAVPSG